MIFKILYELLVTLSLTNATKMAEPRIEAGAEDKLTLTVLELRRATYGNKSSQDQTAHNMASDLDVLCLQTLLRFK